MTPSGFELASEKRDAIVTEFGSSGRQWVENFPRLIDSCVQRWKLELTGIATAGLPINVIFYAETESGQPAVLKIGYPHTEQKTEIIALRAYKGRYAVRLLGWDDENGALLLERVIPGGKLRGVSSDRSRIRINLIGDLPIAAAGVSGLPSFGDWIDRAFCQFREQRTQLSGDEKVKFLAYLELAESIYAALSQEHRQDFLLHGDLHHENILLDEERGWLAIDPKGVIGPRLMECGRYLHNFIEDEIAGIGELQEASNGQILQVLEQRFETFAGMLEFDHADIVAATYVDLVLSTCWTINANQQVDFKKLAVLDSMVRK